MLSFNQISHERQRSLSAKVYGQLHLMLQNETLEEIDNTRLGSLSLSHARAPLNIVPNVSLGIHMHSFGAQVINETGIGIQVRLRTGFGSEFILDFDEKGPFHLKKYISGPVTIKKRTFKGVI